jgi:hypothetical protein
VAGLGHEKEFDMNTNYRRIMSGVLLAAMAGLSVTACTSRTYIREQPVVVGDSAPATVVVPDRDPDIVIVDD